MHLSTFTFVFDAWYYSSFLYVYNDFALSFPDLTAAAPLLAAIGIACLNIISIIHECLQYYMIGHMVGKEQQQKMAKVLSGTDWHLYANFLKILAFITSSAYVFGMIGFFEWTDLRNVRVLFKIFVDSIALSIFKDITSMYFIHPMMHKHLYYLHREHHKPKLDCTLFASYVIGIPDIVIENTCGPLLVRAGYFLLGRQCTQIHIAAYLLSLNADAGIHSINPFRPYTFIPFIDSFFTFGVCHKLHHALNRDYFTSWPIHQFNSAKKQEDCERYNSYFGTNFEFHSVYGWKKSDHVYCYETENVRED